MWLWLSHVDKLDSLHELVSFCFVYILFPVAQFTPKSVARYKLLFNRIFYTISIYLMQWNAHIHAISNLQHTQPILKIRTLCAFTQVTVQSSHFLSIFYCRTPASSHRSNLSNCMWTLTSTTFSLTVSLECSLSLGQYQPMPHPQKRLSASHCFTFYNLIIIQESSPNSPVSLIFEWKHHSIT